jgi:hypothetical protein
MKWRAGFAALVLAAIAAPDAWAIHQLKSLYTVVDLGECKAVKAQAATDVRMCEGLPGYPIYVVENARKIYLSVGSNAAASLAAQQTLSAANTVFEPGTKRTTVEWRFIIRDEKPVPYATIVRYFTREGKDKGEVLVVMRVAGGEACHVAYVDALANSDAMVLARQAADVRGRANACPPKPVVLGATGRSPL